MLQVILWLSAAGPSAGSGPVVVVEARYPGANARVVAETIAAPIEQQVNGVERQLQLQSRCTDGKYLLAASFTPGTPARPAKTAVQQRVELAEPMLPEAVRRIGLMVKAWTPPALLVVCTSPDRRYDAMYLGNFASLRVKDELARVVGVGDVVLVGGVEPRVAVHLDGDRLAARALSPTDVIKALDQKPPAKIGGRLGDIEQIEDLVLKTGPDGQSISLRDVARVEIGAGAADVVLQKGLSCVALAISRLADADADLWRRGVEDRLNQLRPNLPVGMRLDIGYDAGALDADYLLCEFHAPAAASQERIIHLLTEGANRLKDAPAVKELTTFTANPFELFERPPCVLLRLTASHERKIGRDELIDAVRKTAASAPEAQVRVHDGPTISGPSMNFAVCGAELSAAYQLADRLVCRLRENRNVAAVSIDPSSVAQPRIETEVDRDKTKALGVSLDDLTSTLSVALGGKEVRRVELLGRTMRVEVRFGDIHDPDGLQRLKVVGAEGRTVPLEALVAVRQVAAPAALDRVDLQSAVRISVGAASGAAALRKVVETEFKTTREELRLGAHYTLKTTGEHGG